MMREQRDDRGVTIVETAFALPILFMFVMGLADLGIWTFNANQATNAARDGARAAIIDYRYADDPTHESYQAVVERIEQRLAGRSLSVENVEVSCVRADGGTGCAGAHADRDQIRVEVDWTWDLVTPVAGIIGLDEGEASGVATMTIVGKPGVTPPDPPDTTTSTSSTSAPSTSTTTPGPCAISNFTVSPDPAGYQGNTKALQTIDIRFTVAGSGCSGLAVQLLTPMDPTDPTDAPKVQSATCKTCPSSPSAPTNQHWEYRSSDKVWNDGCAEVRVFWAEGPTGEHKSQFKVGSGSCGVPST